MKKISCLFLKSILLIVSITVTYGAQPGERIVGTEATIDSQSAKVTISNFQFTPKALTVEVGTTVEWVNEGGRHTVEADNGAFKSDVLVNGAKFAFKFDKPGTYQYYCGIHGDKGGKDMSGKIIVKKK